SRVRVVAAVRLAHQRLVEAGAGVAERLFPPDRAGLASEDLVDVGDRREAEDAAARRSVLVQIDAHEGVAEAQLAEDDLDVEADADVERAGDHDAVLDAPAPGGAVEARVRIDA